MASCVLGDGVFGACHVLSDLVKVFPDLDVSEYLMGEGVERADRG